MNDEEKDSEEESRELTTEKIRDDSALVEVWDSATTEHKVHDLKDIFYDYPHSPTIPHRLDIVRTRK
jgi:hypothetical protein